MQSAWIPTVRRSYEPRDQRGPRRGVLPLWNLGDPALDLDREHRGGRGRCSPSSGGGSAAFEMTEVVQSFVLVAVSSAGARWPSVGGFWHLLDSALGQSLPAQIVSLGGALALGLRRLLRRVPVARRCVSWRRCCDCGAAALGRWRRARLAPTTTRRWTMSVIMTLTLDGDAAAVERYMPRRTRIR